MEIYIQGEPIIYVLTIKMFLLLCSFRLTLLLTATDIMLKLSLYFIEWYFDEGVTIKMSLMFGP